jgi:leucyl aminopeptidase
VEVKLVVAPFHEVNADALVAPVFEAETVESEWLRPFDQRTDGMIGTLIATGELRGRLDETTYLARSGAFNARRLLLMGAGPREKAGGEIICRVAGTGARFFRHRGVRSVAFLTRPEWPLEPSIQALVEGALLGLFEIDTYKTQNRENRLLEELIFIGPPGQERLLGPAIERGKILAEATNFARALVNEPSSVLTPTELATRATEMAKRFNLGIEILDESQLKDLGMGALLAVARGSDEPVKFIVLRYHPQPSAPTGSGERLALIGKGVTFDTGGISLKRSQGVDRMKYDMAGSATVLGALQAIARLRPAIEVMGLIPAVENMPSGRAQKPGDVIRSMHGKTIEVMSTDAEGRLIMADAITYARQQDATKIIDVATLTSGSVSTFGSIYTPVLGNDQQLIDDIIEAGNQAGEQFWQLPLDEDYREQIKSSIADIKNTGGRKASTITAAYFLKEFAEQTSWAHLDIAGTAWLEERQPHLSTGPTGIGVRTLVGLAQMLAQRA